MRPPRATPPQRAAARKLSHIRAAAVPARSVGLSRGGRDRSRAVGGSPVACGTLDDVGPAVGERVDVDRNLPSVEIPSRVLNELYAHALETLPEECCGLIVGDDEERHAELVRCRNEMTLRHREEPEVFPRDGREAFYMSPLDYMRAHEKAEAGGRRVTAIYHSHVGVGAYLSEMDQEFAAGELFPFPDADHIVVAVLDRKVDSVAFFRRSPQGFTGRTVSSGT